MLSHIHDSTDTSMHAGGLANTKVTTDISGSINTGLLPSWLGFTATTRQNDLDTSVTISFQPGAGGNRLTGGGNAEESSSVLNIW